MSLSDAIAGASKKAAGKRPYFFTPEVERVLAITMALAQEVSVLRMRLDSTERLLDAKDLVKACEIETYAPNATAAAERGQWNQEYIARILRIIHQEAEAIADPDEDSAESFGEMLARER